MPLKTYRELEVWQRGVELVEAVYRLTREFPGGEKFGLTSQLQRAAVSIPANIAEGYARGHRREYVQHLMIARGSMAEVETLLTVAARVELIDRERAVDVWNLLQSIGQMLNRLISALRRTPASRPGTRTPEPGPRS